MKKVLILIAIFLIGCSSKKNTYKFDSNQKFDSISYQSERIIYPSLKDTVYIKSPCDSLGNLRPFKQSFTTTQGKISIEGKDNQITAKIDLKGTSTTEINTNKTSKEKSKSESKSEKIIVVNDWKLILALALSILLNIVFIINKIRAFKNP